ncbi:hypothetical protein BSKO_05425 [Bryopsis sp. KO-2023]|nr:hypothetical protein BSKO_05425 [Bryopsis sp. KO-2023]
MHRAFEQGEGEGEEVMEVKEVPARKGKSPLRWVRPLYMIDGVMNKEVTEQGGRKVVKVVCNLCGERVSFHNSSLTTPVAHAKTHRIFNAEDLDNRLAQLDPNAKTDTTRADVMERYITAAPYQARTHAWERIARGAALWVAMEGLPLSVCESRIPLRGGGGKDAGEHEAAAGKATEASPDLRHMDQSQAGQIHDTDSAWNGRHGAALEDEDVGAGSDAHPRRLRNFKWNLKWDWMPCMCHVLHNAVCDTFKAHKTENSEFHLSLRRATQFVEHMNRLLGIKGPCQAWLDKNYAAFVDGLERKHWVHLQGWMTALEPVMRTSKVLESETKPTAGSVLKVLFRLIEHLNAGCPMNQEGEGAADGDLLKLMKMLAEHVRARMDSPNWVFACLVIATLDTTVRQVREEIKALMLQKMEEVGMKLDNDPADVDMEDCFLNWDTPTSQSAAPPAGAQTQADEFAEAELTRFMESKFWATEGTAFPVLKLLAADFLCVPASSSSSERSFSKTGAIVRARRAKLSTKNIRYLSFLSWNGQSMLPKAGRFPEIKKEDPHPGSQSGRTPETAGSRQVEGGEVEGGEVEGGEVEGGEVEGGEVEATMIC